MKSKTLPGARPRRGQQLTEFTILSMALLMIGGGIMHFAPDMLGVITIYLRGFYVILGFPLG